MMMISTLSTYSVTKVTWNVIYEYNCKSMKDFVLINPYLTVLSLTRAHLRHTNVTIEVTSSQPPTVQASCLQVVLFQNEVEYFYKTAGRV
jgi:hypothetical protein